MSANARGLTELLIRERKAMLRFLARYLDRSGCEDAYQTMYLKLANISADQRIDNGRAYLYKVAYHQAVDRARAEQRERVLLDQVAQLLTEPAFNDDNQTLQAQVDLQHLTEIILAMPERTRRIFVLSRYHGMPEREIAKELGVSKSLVAKHVRRALEHIEQQLGAW